MPRRFYRIGLIGMTLALGAALAASAADRATEPAPAAVGIEQLHRLDLLPRFRDSVHVASISSYDRTGGNDDGFSGKDSFVRKEGDGLVIADLKGPGAIYRVWTPTPTDDPIEFYFDGETQPRVSMKFRELFDGSHPPFVAPVVGYGAGGFWSYLPLPYRQSCKVIIRAPRVQFYQVNYATYAPGTPVETYSARDRNLHVGVAKDRKILSDAGLIGGLPVNEGPLEKSQQLLDAAGEDVTAFSAGGQPTRTDRVTKRLAPGKTVTLWESKRGGRILGLRLGPADALAGKARDIALKITWDGDRTPAVLCPAGDFFGASWGDPAVRSLLVGTVRNQDYAYFPMPFDRSARIELVSERAGGEPIDVTAEVVSTAQPRRSDEGRFYAVWRRENPTAIGKPFTWLETEGRGHVVGVTLQAQGPDPGITPFFEGDDQVTLDGELAIHGTGSEDAFNGGWYDVPGRWEARTSFPLSGCLDYKRPMARSGAYRLFLTDAYAFRKSIHLAIEHAPERNAIPTDYVGMTYLYAEGHPAMAGTLAPVASRAVHDPERVVFTPGWYMPVHSFSVQNATLARKEERIGNDPVRVLSMRAHGEDVFGPHHVSLLCEVPVAGRYRVSAEAVEGPEGGIVQLYQQEHTRGEAVDLYARSARRRAGIPLGTLELKEGVNQVFLKLIGKNPQSASEGLDLVTLTLERLR
jgi:hypothetical protein